MGDNLDPLEPPAIPLLVGKTRESKALTSLNCVLVFRAPIAHAI
jgi:hypothetical protein